MTLAGSLRGKNGCGTDGNFHDGPRGVYMPVVGPQRVLNFEEGRGCENGGCENGGCEYG